MRNMLAGWLALAIAATAVASANAADEPVADKAAAVAETKEFKPPDGWRPKKRGKFTVYCRKDYNVKGTRLPAETCYDESGIRAMLEAQRDDQTTVDQMRRICSNDATCGAN
ncbi:MAG TPA: hypothetical protein VNO53_00270 [Steroidobacteraceae bacterium]|nr:hypothetical protein [Steroidobacteraceae bacterium]